MAGRKANRNNPKNIEARRTRKRAAKKEAIESKVEEINSTIASRPSDTKPSVPEPVVDPAEKLGNIRSLIAKGVELNLTKDEKDALKEDNERLAALGKDFVPSGEVVTPLTSDKVVPKNKTEKAEANRAKAVGARQRKRMEKRQAEQAAANYPAEGEELTPSGLAEVQKKIEEFNKPLSEMPGSDDSLKPDILPAWGIAEERKLRPVQGPDTRTQTASRGSTVSGTGIFTPLSASESAALPMRRAVAKPEETILTNEQRVAAGLGLVGGDRGMSDVEHNGETLSVPSDIATAHALYLADHAKNPAAANRKALGVAKGDAGVEVLHPHTHANIEGGYQTLARVSQLYNLTASKAEKKVREYSKSMGIPYTDALMGLHNIGMSEQRALTKTEDIGSKVGHPEDMWVHPETGQMHKVSDMHPDMPEHFMRSKGTLIGTYKDVNGIRRVTNPSYLGWNKITNPRNPEGPGVWNLIKSPQIPASLKGEGSKLQTMTGFVESQIKGKGLPIGSTAARAAIAGLTNGMREELEIAPKNVLTSFNDVGEQTVSGKKPEPSAGGYSLSSGFTAGPEGVKPGRFNIPFSHLWNEEQFGEHTPPQPPEGIHEGNVSEVLLEKGLPTMNRYGHLAVSTGKERIARNKKGGLNVAATQEANKETLVDETGAGIPTPPRVVSGADQETGRRGGAGSKSRKYVSSNTGMLINLPKRDAIQGFTAVDHTAADADSTPIHFPDQDSVTYSVRADGSISEHRGRSESTRKWNAGQSRTPWTPEETSHGYGPSYDANFKSTPVQDTLPGLGIHSSNQFLGMPKIKKTESFPAVVKREDVSEDVTPRSKVNVEELQQNMRQILGGSRDWREGEETGLVHTSNLFNIGKIQTITPARTEVTERETKLEPRDLVPYDSSAVEADKPMFPDIHAAHKGMIKFGGKWDDISGRQWLGTTKEGDLRTVEQARLEATTSARRAKYPIPAPTNVEAPVNLSRTLSNLPSTSEGAELQQETERRESRRADLMAAFGITGEKRVAPATTEPGWVQPGVGPLETSEGVPFRRTANPQGARRGTRKKTPKEE
jgi:hypothetical protein